MGYYSDLRISITKRDYLLMIEKNQDDAFICNYILNPDNAYIKEYEENGIKCVLLQQFNFKYYQEFEEIQTFEGYLKETKNGYVFLRIGSRWDDIEYRNTAKYKELEIPFKFIDAIKKETIKSQDINLNKTHQEYIFTDKKEIEEYYEGNSNVINFINEQSNRGIQFKLELRANILSNESLGILYMRKPTDKNYIEYKTEYINTDDMLFFLGYLNPDEFLGDINEEIEEELE